MTDTLPDYFAIKNMSANQGLKYYEKLALAGDMNAQRLWAESLIKGTDIMGRAVKHDTKKGLKLLRDLVGRGDSGAMLLLGDYYRLGLYTLKKDPVKAGELLAKSAEKGQPAAKFHYAGLLLNAPEENRDYPKIIELLTEAASLGVKDAKLFLGRLYLYGQGVRADVKKAVSIFEELAAEGHPEACYRLGCVFFDENSGHYDEKKGAQMLEKASRGGNLDAIALLAARYEAGEGVDFDPGRALSLYRSYRDLAPGDGAVLFKIAELLLFKNFALQESYKGEGADCLKKAAAANYPLAMFELGYALYTGQYGIASDEVRARRLVLNAAATGDPEVLLKTGLLFADGLLFEEDPAEALKYMSRAASKGCGDAFYEMGCMYQDGEGVPENAAEARKCFKQAAESGSGWGAYEYGWGLLQSKDPKDAEKGIEFLTKAVTAGIPLAMYAAADYFEEMLEDPLGEDHDKVSYLRDAAYATKAALQYGANSHLRDSVTGLLPPLTFRYLKYIADNFDSYTDEGIADIFTALGKCYENGIGCTPDLESAVKAFERGVGLNQPIAMSGLSVLYSRGRGVEQDFDKSTELMQKALALLTQKRGN